MTLPFSLSEQDLRDSFDMFVVIRAQYPANPLNPMNPAQIFGRG